MQIKATTKDAYDLFHKGSLALAEAERFGIRIDVEYCQEQKRRLTKRVEIAENNFKKTDIYKVWFVKYKDKTNINSSTQLADVLYNILQVSPIKGTITGRGSTDEDSLSKLNVKGLEYLIQVRKLKKMRDTYLDAFYREAVDGKIHPIFSLHTVASGRSSANSPNFQNIPKRDEEAMRIIRSALFPRIDRQLVEVDYSQLEVSASQFYHNDPVMYDYLAHNGDMHADMAKEIFIIDKFDKKDPVHSKLRKATKNQFVFPQFYGDYYGNNAIGLCEWVQLPQSRWRRGQGIQFTDGIYISDHFISKGINSFDKFLEHLRNIEYNFWNKKFKVYHQWKDKWVNEYNKKGYLDMLTGFRCSGYMRRNEIINYPIQGTAFHCLLWSFIRLNGTIKKEGLDTRLIGQIHDAIVLDVKPDELNYIKELLVKVMTQDIRQEWEWVNVPLRVEIDVFEVNGSWASKKV